MSDVLLTVLILAYWGAGLTSFWAVHADWRNVTWGQFVLGGWFLFGLFWPFVWLSVGVMLLLQAEFWNKPVFGGKDAQHSETD